MYIYSPTTLRTRDFLTITLQRNIINSISLSVHAYESSLHCGVVAGSATSCSGVHLALLEYRLVYKIISHWCVRGSLFFFVVVVFFKYPRVAEPALCQEKTTASAPKSESQKMKFKL